MCKNIFLARSSLGQLDSHFCCVNKTAWWEKKKTPIPCAQTPGKHRGPVHLSPRWHSSYKWKRISSSSAHSLLGLTPCERSIFKKHFFIQKQKHISTLNTKDADVNHKSAWFMTHIVLDVSQPIKNYKSIFLIVIRIGGVKQILFFK